MTLTEAKALKAGDYIHHATKNRRYLLHLFDGFELNEENYFDEVDYDEAYRSALPVIGDYTEYQMSEL